MSDVDPRMRLRCWIAGRLVEETWIDVSNPDCEQITANTAARHAAVVASAELVGLPWLVEAYDPAMPEHEAYQRFGTDLAGMVDPRPREER